MPLYPPRSETVKKKAQLLQRDVELIHAIKNKCSDEKLTKAVKNYRHAQLSLLKAKIHVLKEKEFQEKPHNYNMKDLEDAIREWEIKTDEAIINKFK